MEFARIFNLCVKMPDIQAKFYKKARKSISLYYSTTNIVLFSNRIKKLRQKVLKYMAKLLDNMILLIT